MSLRPRVHLLLLGFILVAGCAGEQAPAEASVTFVDDLQRQVVLERPVTRVVSLAPNLTEIVFAAGGGDKLVGVTTADDYPPAVDTLPHISALPIDFEAIAALQPDLALATDQVNSPRDAETFATLGVPVVFLSFPDLESITAGIRKAGEVLGTMARAEAVADSLEREVQLIRSITSMTDERPLVLFLIGDETLNSFGNESYMHELIELAGGRSATEAFDTPAPVLSDEFVLTTQPDVIILPMGDDYDAGRLLDLHPTWENVPAVRQGRIYSLSPDLILRPGPRLIEGVRQMAEYLHPELFTPPQLAQQADSTTPAS